MQPAAESQVMSVLCSLIEEEAATSTHASWEQKSADFRQRMILHYGQPCVDGIPSCTILHQFDPTLSRSAGYYRNKIEAVAEHIFPKRDSQKADDHWEFDVWDAANGIFLLKDLELKFQAGKWVLIPDRLEPELESPYVFKVHVLESLRRTCITYYDQMRRPAERAKVKDNHGKVIRYSDIHNLEIKLTAK
eukprot:6476530-Amphidinium_carterae.1